MRSCIGKAAALQGCSIRKVESTCSMTSPPLLTFQRQRLVRKGGHNVGTQAVGRRLRTGGALSHAEDRQTFRTARSLQNMGWGMRYLVPTLLLHPAPPQCPLCTGQPDGHQSCLSELKLNKAACSVARCSGHKGKRNGATHRKSWYGLSKTP